MRRHRRTGLLGALTLIAAGMSALVGVPSAVAATGDPATNIAPSPSYWSTCSTSGPLSTTCTNAVLAAINHARSLEGVGPMVLPSGYASLTPAEQTFVVSNLERVDRGLRPAAGMVGSLDTIAQSAAVNDADPVLNSWTIGSFSANRWGSNWAGDLNALAADYDWMYEDGWSSTGSFNLDCQTATGSGCWGHRHNILSSYGGEELITGVGSAPQSQWTSFAQIFVAGSGSYPAFALSWADVSSQVTPPNTSTPPSTGQVATVATIASTTTVAAGHTASVTGRLFDAGTSLPIGGAGVLMCHRTALELTGSCSSMLTDTLGAVHLTLHPLLRTEYWLAFPGTANYAASSSRANSIFVTNAVGARAALTRTGWVIYASFAPVRGQLLRLQLRTATGWLTLVKTPLRARSMTFRVRAGRYRLWVGPVKGLLDGYAYVAAR